MAKGSRRASLPRQSRWVTRRDCRSALWAPPLAYCRRSGTHSSSAATHHLPILGRLEPARSRPIGAKSERADRKARSWPPERSPCIGTTPLAKTAARALPHRRLSRRAHQRQRPPQRRRSAVVFFCGLQRERLACASEPAAGRHSLSWSPPGVQLPVS